MELKEITAKLKTIPNGANIGITYRSSMANKLNATAKKEGHTIEKEGRVVLRKGLRKDRDPENIPGPRSWGKHVSDEDSTTNGQSFIIEKNGGYYVDFYMGSAGGVGIQAPKYKYFLDGKEVAKEELEPYMQPAAYRLLEKPHDHYSIKIEHIIDIRYNGRRTEGLTEELDEETYFDFEHDIYNALVDVIYKYKGVTANEVERALENFEIRFFEDESEEEIFDEPLDDDLEESYDDYEGKFNDPLEDGEYSLSDFGYKHSYGSDNSIALSKRTREFGSGSRRLTKDLNRNNRFNENCESCVDQYESNVLNHIYELEDEGEYDLIEYFKNDFPMLIDYSESGSTITLKFDSALDKSDLEQYLMYVPKHFSEKSINSAKVVGGNTIVINESYKFRNGSRRFTKAANESLKTSYNNRRLNEHISDSDAQKYGYRNAAELKAANKINK